MERSRTRSHISASASSKTLARLDGADEGWRASLDDLGIPFDYVAPPQLKKGILSERKYHTLILPMSLAISQEEKAAIKAFVQSGGIVLADSEAGLMDERCQPQPKGILDDLFGIEQATLLHKSPGAAARATTARAVEVTQDQTGSKRTVYFNSFGKGQAIYKGGNLLVHPSLLGKNLKEVAEPAYEAVSKATPTGTWVKYVWQGNEKNAYVRNTRSGLIVGSGY